MATLTATLRQLRQERARAQREVSRFDEAIAAIEKLVRGGSRGGPRAGRRRRRLSAAARKRIAAAQKARWAKIKGAA